MSAVPLYRSHFRSVDNGSIFVEEDRKGSDQRIWPHRNALFRRSLQWPFPENGGTLQLRLRAGRLQLSRSPLHPQVELSARDFFVDNLLVRIHFIVVMIKWTGLAPQTSEFPFFK